MGVTDFLPVFPFIHHIFFRALIHTYETARHIRSGPMQLLDNSSPSRAIESPLCVSIHAHPQISPDQPPCLLSLLLTAANIPFPGVMFIDS